ncbi:MAG TPA: membrane dipeptidase, partial [Polyangiaceae bacterium]
MDAWIDHRRDPGAWAKSLGISRSAVDLYLASDVIDLHLDSFIWRRVLGRVVTRRRDPWFPVRGVAFGHADLPRLREAQIAGATWVVTTNPLRDGPDRLATFERNVGELERELATEPDDVAIARNLGEYRAARSAGKHAAFIGVQGGNAIDADLDVLDRLPEGLLLRVTLVHLSNSELGVTSSPLGSLAGGGLARRGQELVEKLDEKRIFVDLAHASRETFWDAVRAHDRTRPLAVTHTGVAGVHQHWRNVDDEQLRAVAETGGVVGIMYHAPFLGDRLLGGRVESIVRHLEHVRNVAGEETPALGSDWDGAIVTPRDMPTCLELPRLVEAMLRRNWPERAVERALGGNFLRALAALRG